MIDTTQTGGPAFPHAFVPHQTEETWVAKGMTLRDYFAAKAMQAMMTCDKYVGIVGVNLYEQNRAKDAYAVADAMLKAREKK